MKRVLVWVAAAMLAAGPALAQEVERTGTPSWVAAAPQEPVPTITDHVPVRTLFVDNQIRFDADGQHQYVSTRTLIQNAQGLAMASTVIASWAPPRQRIEVHAVRIIRNGQVIDVLDGQSFQTLRRERNLESSMLDGRLTATLQPRDLRVGDILETAFTIHDDGGVLGRHREARETVGSRAADRYRLRVSWPTDLPIRVRAGDPWSELQPRRTADGYEFQLDERALTPARIPLDIPTRFKLIGLVEFTDFAEWGDISRLMAPLYAEAATLEPNSPLLAEIERIRQAYPAVEDQIAAAIRLVQDDVRYLALSMGEGGYVPTTADETWRSRYGDCKGKTVLLMALLRGLGVEAEPALVSTGLGDGLNEYLPAVGWFDHVIVRAVVDGRVYWIDGARVGDRGLQGLIPPAYHWALPVRAEGAELETIDVPPLQIPTFAASLTFDASEGLDVKAKVSGEMTFNGDAASAVRAQMAAIPAAQTEAALKAMWSREATLDVESVASAYDDATNSYRFTMQGTARLPWTPASGGRFLAVPDSTLQSVGAAERSDELLAPYKDLPYAVLHPVYVTGAVRVILPYEGQGFRTEGADVDTTAGGYRLERRTSLEDGVVTMTVASRSLTGEVSAADMALARNRQDMGGLAVRIRAPSNYRATAADRARMDTSSSDVADLVDRAEDLARSDDFDGALTLLDRALELEPDNVEAVMARGAARLANSDYAGARTDYDHAVDLDPAELEAVIGQGRVAYLEGRFGDAVISFSVALRLDPDAQGGLAARGASYYQLRRFDRSLADYRALAAGGASSTSLYGELRALLRLNRHDEARQILDTALAESPTDVVALEQLVRLAAESGRPADALPALDRALELSPDDFNIRILRAEARIRSGAADDARADLTHLRQATQADPLLLNNLCWTQGLLGFDLDQALADCDAALAQLGEAASIIDSRAMVLLHLGRYDEARAAYETALAAEPNQLASIYGRGLARLALGDAGGREDVATASARDIDSGLDYAVFEQRHPEVR